MLEQGDLLEFCKAIYFFVESLAVIGAVPAGYADRVDGTLVRLEPAQRHIDSFRGVTGAGPVTGGVRVAGAGQ
jgi:hypothetical protein